MSASPDGTGPLRQVLQQALDLDTLNDRAANLADYTVLSAQNDPYRLDLPDNHRNGKWFAEVVERLVPDEDTVHLRGLHYRLVAAADVVRPDNGLPYINTEECWLWLQAKAAKAGRWLGYVDFDRIVDERNAAPELFLPEDEETGIWSGLTGGSRIELPSPQSAIPSLYGSGFDSEKQPYRIVLVGEKTSLREVLSPVAEMVGGELVLPTGEMSDTLIAGIATRAHQDGRPAVVLYFSDFDPSGHQMPISVARKLQALRDLKYGELDIQLHQVALTLSQVRQLELPSTPLKATELRGDRWRAAMHHEQTEIDALAALRPAELRQIALEAIRPFFDRTLSRRQQEARTGWYEQALPLLRAHPHYQTHVAQIENALALVSEAVEAFHAAQDAAREGFEAIELPPIEPPEAQIAALAPRPLFRSGTDFPSATRRMIAHKALEET